MPETNSGSTVADRPPRLMMRSSGRLTLSAAITPPRTPIGTTSTNATAASFIELASASRTKGADRRTENVGRPHVALQEVEDPLAILHQQRPVDAELVSQGIDGALVGKRSQNGATDITRQHLAADENHHAEQEQRDQGQAKPLGEVACHQAATPPLEARTSVTGLRMRCRDKAASSQSARRRSRPFGSR